MNLKEFREQTKDLPDDTIIYVLSEGAWTPPTSLKTRTESLLYVEGQNVPESLKNRVELQIELLKS